MKRLEDEGIGKVFIDHDTRDLLAFFTGEKSDAHMSRFLQACEADIKEAKYGTDTTEGQKFVSDLMREFKEL